MKKDTILKTIEVYGEELESCVCMEEAAELIQAISKIKRHGLTEKTADHLAEEMADVLISIELLKAIYKISDGQIEWWIEKKQTRQENRIQKIEAVNKSQI